MKLFSSEEIIQYLDPPLVAFILLLVISHLVYLRLFSRITPSLASGSIVMALGIFSLESLRQLGFPSSLMLYVALEVFIIGLYLGINLVQAILEDEIIIKDYTDELAVGTWVVGSVTMILLLNQVDKTLVGFIALLCITAFSLFVYYIWIVMHWYYLYFRKRTRLQVNPMLLLSAVSVQAMVLLLSELFHDLIPAVVFETIILAGLFLYLLGLTCILVYLFYSRSRHLLAGWVNENTINHGALSITGLAMINTQAFPEWSVHIMWYIILIVFVMAECLDVSRLLERFKFKSIKRAIGVYHTSQWARIFTFGMFYAFNVAYYEHEYSTDPVTMLIVDYGQYVVAALMLVELIILLKYVCQKEKTK